MTTKKIIIFRHAQALDDIDNNAYTRFLDENMPLTEKGKRQIVELAPSISPYLGQSVELFHNGLVRLEQSATLLSQIFPQKKWGIHVDKLLDKQNRGEINMENRKRIEEERYKTGVLRYTFPGGESAENTVFRHRQFFDRKMKEFVSCQKTTETIIIITSGFEFRICLMVLLGWDEAFFESLAYPNNCEFKSIEIRPDGSLNLLHEMRRHARHLDPDFVLRM